MEEEESGEKRGDRILQEGDRRERTESKSLGASRARDKFERENYSFFPRY